MPREIAHSNLGRNDSFIIENDGTTNSLTYYLDPGSNMILIEATTDLRTFFPIQSVNLLTGFGSDHNDAGPYIAPLGRFRAVRFRHTGSFINPWSFSGFISETLFPIQTYTEKSQLWTSTPFEITATTGTIYTVDITKKNFITKIAFSLYGNTTIDWLIRIGSGFIAETFEQGRTLLGASESKQFEFKFDPPYPVDQDITLQVSAGTAKGTLHAYKQ